MKEESGQGMEKELVQLPGTQARGVVKHGGSEEEVNKRQSTQGGKIVLNVNEAKGSCSC